MPPPPPPLGGMDKRGGGGRNVALSLEFAQAITCYWAGQSGRVAGCRASLGWATNTFATNFDHHHCPASGTDHQYLVWPNEHCACTALRAEDQDHLGWEPAVGMSPVCHAQHSIVKDQLNMGNWRLVSHRLPKGGASGCFYVGFKEPRSHTCANE